MKRRKWQFLSAVAALGLMLLAAGGVRGDVIQDLSTGIATWTVSAANPYSLDSPDTKVAALGGTAAGAWIKNDPGVSMWIDPAGTLSSNDSTNNPVNDTPPNVNKFTDDNAPPIFGNVDLYLTYKTTFTVSGSGDAIVGKVTIDPQATSDNDLISYTLTGPGVSGVPVTISPTTGSTPFHGWVSLPTIALPDAGTYTLSFVVVNRAQTGGNPSGFRAEALVATPEPASVGMMATAVVVFAGYGLRRRMKKS